MTMQNGENQLPQLSLKPTGQTFKRYTALINLTKRAGEDRYVRFFSKSTQSLRILTSGLDLLVKKLDLRSSCLNKHGPVNFLLFLLLPEM